ncbi:MAG: TolC family protein, partial [Candidatus Omnitrophota bacterium]
MKKLSIRFLMAVIMVAAICPGVSRADEALSWYDCIKEAQKNHPDLISAQGAISQSEAAKQTAASGLFPQISADLQASRGETTTGNSSGRTHRTQNSYGYGAQGSQLLFDGLKTIDNTHAAVENIKAAEYNFKFISSEVRLRLRGAFIALLKAQEALTITEDIRKIRQSNLDLITLRYKSGMEHKGALMTAEANLAQAAFEIAQARRALEVAQRSLTKEMGRSLFAALRAQGELSVAERSLQRPDFEALAAQNPSLERLDALTKAASYTIKSAQGSYLPQLSAQVSAGRTDTSWLPQNDQWNAGLTLSYPIFEGGLRSAEVGQARAAFIQARENQRSAKDGSTRDRFSRVTF